VTDHDDKSLTVIENYYTAVVSLENIQMQLEIHFYNLNCPL